MSSEANPLSSQRAIAAMCAGTFLAPVIAVVNFETNYAMVGFACQTGHHWALHISPPIALLIALLGFRIAWHYWREAGGDWPNEESGVIPRTRFVGMFGMIFSSISCALILMQWIPSFLESPCVG